MPSRMTLVCSLNLHLTEAREYDDWNQYALQIPFPRHVHWLVLLSNFIPSSFFLPTFVMLHLISWCIVSHIWPNRNTSLQVNSKSIQSGHSLNFCFYHSPMYTVQRKSEPQHKDIVHLWEFLFELLADESCGSIITWTTEENREFKLKNPEQVAKLWGAYKGVKAMNYEKLSRALRTYYSKGIIVKVSKIANISLLRQLNVHVVILILIRRIFPCSDLENPFSYQDDSMFR